MTCDPCPPDARQTPQELDALRDEIAQLAQRLRISAAGGGSTVSLSPLVCIHIARTLDRGLAPPAIIDARPPVDPITRLWLRVCLAVNTVTVLADLLAPAARLVARWVHG